MDIAPITTVDDLIAVLEASATPAMPGGEHLDQLAHGLQCGHELAMAYPHDVELQVAGLVHDIGHGLLPRDGVEVEHDMIHGIAGGNAVRGLLGDRVAELVELHVPAKRFLVTVDEEYGGVLSSESTMTLANQGGPMTDDETSAFKALPEVDAAVALRRADEAAKFPGRVVPGLDHWRPVLEQLAASR